MPTSTSIKLTIESPPFKCSLCENYVKKQQEFQKLPLACCEGACLRGEIARQAANALAVDILPSKIVRVCLPGIISTQGQRALFLQGKAVVVEGCALKCGTRLLKSVIPDCDYQSIIADRLYDFDRNLYGIEEISKDEINNHVQAVISYLVGKL